MIQIGIESKAIGSCINQWLTIVTLGNREPSRGETSTGGIRERDTTENLQLQSLENPYWGHHHCNRQEVAHLSLMHEHQQNSEIIDSRRWKERASRFLTQGNEKFHVFLFFFFFAYFLNKEKTHSIKINYNQNMITCYRIYLSFSLAPVCGE